MNEQPLAFGPGHGLIGVHREPETARPGAPTVLLLNAGLLHKVGPNRLNVTLARRLSELGFHSLRFDMSGIGDSRMRQEGISYVERSLLDIRDAIAAAESNWGADRFVMVGLCSGAFNALNIAVEDGRVVGCVFLDGYSFPTLRYRIRHYGPRLLEGRRWIRLAQRKLGLGDRKPEAGQDMAVFQTEAIERDSFHEKLRRLIAKETQLLFVFTGGGPQPFNYPTQLFDAFPDLDLRPVSRIKWMPESDHTYTLGGHREELMTEIEDWIVGLKTGAGV